MTLSTPETLSTLRPEPSLARGHARRGLLLREEGRLDEALPWLRQAAELEPDNADFWEHLAELHEEHEDIAECIRCWECVLALEPARPNAHRALGWVKQEQGWLREAEEHYLMALRQHPDAGGSHVNLGGLYEERGELDRAEAAYREALRLQPNYPLPHARLAVLLRGNLPGQDLAALERRLADPDLPRGPRARLLFGLAHVLDARGEYARAAECLRPANALTLESFRGQRAYDPTRHEQFVGRLLQQFNADFFRRTAGAGLDTRLPVFVFGLPRSGTTLVEQVLASHPQIHGAGELPLVRRTFQAIPAVLGLSAAPLDCLDRLQAEPLRRLAGRHEGWLRGLADAPRIVDKMPDNYLYLGLLAALFPRATFVHCRRDLRDVALSCWMTDFRSLRWANSPAHIAGRVRQYARLMEHWRAVLPVPLHEVSYEDTVASLDGVARRLVGACGLEWHPGCLEFQRTRRPVRTASVAQVRQPLYRHAVARWKHYERDLNELFSALPEG